MADRIGFLKQDWQEWPGKKTVRRRHPWGYITEKIVPVYRWGVAYRIVDAAGEDMVLPWNKTKKEARQTALRVGITLKEKSGT